MDWLIKQSERDDLIGDVALDTKRAIEQDLISRSSNFKQVWEYIDEHFEKHNFFIQNTDEDPNEKRREVEKEIGSKLYDSYANSVSPLLCLQLAWDEYESFIKRKKFLSKIKLTTYRQGYVYFIGLTEYDSYVKIGYSSDKNFIRRQKNIETSSPHDTFLIGYIPSDNYIALENELHKKYNGYRKKREWFSIKYVDVKKIITEYGGIIGNADH